MGQVIALIPARSGSKGVPGKNFRELGGVPLWRLAVDCALNAGIWAIVSSDAPRPEDITDPRVWIERPAELASDTAAMVDVVKHAMTQIPGAPDDIWVLLQPTQPFRTPERVREAITLLQESGADSVVSVVPLPLTHHPEFALEISQDHGLVPYAMPRNSWDACREWGQLPTRRQGLEPAYIRDGTCYVFWRKTVRGGTIYGQDVRPLILDPSDTCELDTEADWAGVEARWNARTSVSG